MTGIYLHGRPTFARTNRSITQQCLYPASNSCLYSYYARSWIVSLLHNNSNFFKFCGLFSLNIIFSGPQARATPSWWTHNKCYPHSPWYRILMACNAMSDIRRPSLSAEINKGFSLITSRTLPQKKACIVENIWHLSKSFIPQWHVTSVPLLCFFKNCDATNNRRSDFKTSSRYYCLRYNRLVCRMTPWVSVCVVRVLQCSTACHVISGNRRNYGMYCHVV